MKRLEVKRAANASYPFAIDPVVISNQVVIFSNENINSNMRADAGFFISVMRFFPPSPFPSH